MMQTISFCLGNMTFSSILAQRSPHHAEVLLSNPDGFARQHEKQQTLLALSSSQLAKN